MMLVILASCLACGFFTRLAARALLAKADQPALDERITRYQSKRVGFTMLWSCFLGLSAPLLFFGTTELTDVHPLLMPGTTLCCMLHFWASAWGDWPVRQKFFDDRLGFAHSLFTSMRFLFVFSGYWLAVILAPCFVLWSGPLVWPVSIGVTLFLIIWAWFYLDLSYRLIGAKPIVDDALLQRFQSILARSTVPPPRIGVFGDPGGSFVNAFALPAMRGGGMVLMSGPLLRALQADEAAAIFAHEIAHLEEKRPPHLGRLPLENLAIYLLLVLFPPWLSASYPQHAALLLWLWPLAFIIFMIIRMRGQQARESQGDRRALELCGDGKVLIRALIKLHEANRMPRRQSLELERHSTHPSLARRIQSIRQQMSPTLPAIRRQPTTPAMTKEIPEPELLALQSRDQPERWLLLGLRRVHWLTLPNVPAIPPSHRLDHESASLWRDQALQLKTATYTSLNSLHVRLVGKNHQLRAIDTAGEVTLFDPQPDSIAELEQFLDVIDHQFATSATGGMPYGRLALICPATGFLGFFASLQGVLGFGITLWLLVSCLLAAATRQKPWIAAQMAMGIASVLLSLWHHTDKSWWSPTIWGCLVMLGLISLWGLSLLPRLSKKGPPGIPESPPLGVALLYLILGGIIAFPSLLSMLQEEGALRSCAL